MNKRFNKNIDKYLIYSRIFVVLLKFYKLKLLDVCTHICPIRYQKRLDLFARKIWLMAIFKGWSIFGFDFEGQKINPSHTHTHTHLHKPRSRKPRRSRWFGNHSSFSPISSHYSGALVQRGQLSNPAGQSLTLTLPKLTYKMLLWLFEESQETD